MTRPGLILAAIVAGWVFPVNAQNITLDSPLDYQVIQRFSRDKGLVRITGAVGTGPPNPLKSVLIAPELPVFGKPFRQRSAAHLSELRSSCPPEAGTS